MKNVAEFRGHAGSCWRRCGATECELCRAGVAGDAENFVDKFGCDRHGGERRGRDRHGGERRGRTRWRVKQLA